MNVSSMFSLDLIRCIQRLQLFIKIRTIFGLVLTDQGHTEE